jgi:hypothetical protein
MTLFLSSYLHLVVESLCRIILSEFFLCKKRRRRRRRKKRKSELCAFTVLIGIKTTKRILQMIRMPGLQSIVIVNILKQEEQLTKGGKELKISNQLFFLISINYPLFSTV